MKIHIKIFFAAVLLIFFSCDDEEIIKDDIDTCKENTFSQLSYQQDAKELYYNEIIRNQDHINRLDKYLDTNEVNKLLDIIETVYCLKTEHTDSIFDLYKIHTRYCNSFERISISVDTSSKTINNLINGIRPTGDSTFDEVLTEFMLDSVETSISYPSSNWVSLITNTEYNLIPAKEKLKELNYISISDSEGVCIGDGDNIQIKRYNDLDKIVFSIGYGDCPSGCINHKSWEYHIVNQKAQLIRITNDLIIL